MLTGYPRNWPKPAHQGQYCLVEASQGAEDAMELCRCYWSVNMALRRLGAFLGCQTGQGYQKRQTRRISITRPSAPNGPYCFKSSSQLMRTAALLYLAESSRSLEDISPVEEVCQHIPATLSFVWVSVCAHPSFPESHLCTASLRCSLS